MTAAPNINGVTIPGDNSGTLVLTGTADAIQALLNDSINGLTYLSDKMLTTIKTAGRRAM